MQNSTISETGSNLYFEDKLHLCESDGVDLMKDVCVCFVLPEVLDLYCVEGTAMWNRSQNGVELKHYTKIFSMLVLNICFV